MLWRRDDYAYNTPLSAVPTEQLRPQLTKSRTLLRAAIFIVFASVMASSAQTLHAADYSSVEELFRQGKYREARAIADAEVKRGVWNERWPRLLIKSQLVLGQYDEAMVTYENALKRYSSSIPLRLLGADVYRYNNDPVAAAQQLEYILEIVRRSPWRYSDKENLLAIGRYFLGRGEDAKKVLEMFFDRVRNADANFADAYVATGELALQKHDYALAAKNLDRAAKMKPSDPDIAYMQSIAWRGADSKKAEKLLSKALELNPQHIPSLLVLAENAIDAEQFDQAEEILAKVMQVNLYQPEAWAYQAVIAHLQGHYEAERLLRKAALSRWESNPLVDHLIGKKLSRHYRFEEGAEYQRRAIEKKPDYVDAKFQLAQDLLRIGEDEAGWQMADSVHEEDGYNVVAHNLVTLHDSLSKFVTLQSPGLLVRMDARESRIYGQQVMELLTQARATLTEKYEVQLQEPIAVEIFPKQKDFAIRTFGLPGGDGFLGVCFGRLITANSPASQRDSPSNWKAVLWHEYCHVVTLQKTKNRMPRWLSEGISVYEELERNETWGQTMSPVYREMILGDALTPVSRLSSAFSNPKSGMHLQFAYYESSLVVRYIVDTHGFDVLKKILDDLGIGMPINEALTRYIGSLDVLDQQFAQYAREIAEGYGTEEAWQREGGDEQPDLDPDDPFAQLIEKQPTHFEVLVNQARQQSASKSWSELLETVAQISQLFPNDDVPLSVLSLQARAYRGQGDTENERATLELLAQRSSDAVLAYQRLIEIAIEMEDWDAVATNAERLLSVNPLQASTQKLAALAAQKLGRHDDRVRALTALAEMEPIDPAGLNFQLAQALDAIGKGNESRRRVLMALEQAPRYRDAQKLLLRLIRDGDSENGLSDDGERESSGSESADALNTEELAK